MFATANATTQLVQLGDAEPASVEDHHHGGVGNIDANLDYRRCDEHVGLAGPEARHDLFLLGARHAAMQQGHLQPVELARGEVFVGFGSRARFDLVAGIDQRTHHICLTTGCHLGADVVPHGRLLHFTGSPFGDDGSSSRGQLVEDADVEVAVDGHGSGAWNWRCGHDQHVGFFVALRLGFEHRSLFDTESVLLVDDDHAQVKEVHRLLDESVGADEDVDLARQRLGEDPFAVRGGHTVGQ